MIVMGIRKGAKAPWILKLLAKKVVLLVSSGKNQMSPFLAPLDKVWKNPLVAPLEKILPTPMIIVKMHRYTNRPITN